MEDLGPFDFCAVVLAGGTAARLGGADKASIELHGRTLLTHALDALVDAAGWSSWATRCRPSGR